MAYIVAYRAGTDVQREGCTIVLSGTKAYCFIQEIGSHGEHVLRDALREWCEEHLGGVPQVESVIIGVLERPVLDAIVLTFQNESARLAFRMRWL
jgi:hypothetical protein